MKFKYIIKYNKQTPSDPLEKGIKEARAYVMTDLQSISTNQPRNIVPTISGSHKYSGYILSTAMDGVRISLFIVLGKVLPPWTEMGKV